MSLLLEQYQTLMPFATLALLTVIMVLLDLVSPLRHWKTIMTFLSAVVAWTWAIPYAYAPSETSYQYLLHGDTFSFVFISMILMGTTLTLWLRPDDGRLESVKSSTDIDALIMFAALGGMIMVSAGHLIVLFLGFELLSVCVYALAGLARGERASSESAMKYFILGAFSSAFLLYGMTLVYAATGTMVLSEIGQLASADNMLLMCGLGLMVFGFGFKVSLVPFHFWTPDVYQGAPTSITAFMAVVVKVSAFGAFLRVMMLGFSGLASTYAGLFAVLAVLSMTLGNLAALRQRSVKRMFAYSSIAHAGYALVGFLSLGATESGASATIFYLLSYMFMTVASFGILVVMTSGTRFQYDRDDIDSLSGMGWSRPGLAFMMSIAVLSLAGFPPLAGFMGKLFLFDATLKAGYVNVAIILALNSVVSLYYYLRVLVVMYFKDPVPASEALVSEFPAVEEGSLLWCLSRVSLVVATGATLLIGIYSQYGSTVSRMAAQSVQREIVVFSSR